MAGARAAPTSEIYGCYAGKESSLQDADSLLRHMIKRYTNISEGIIIQP
jgi:hypothetical protein